jgi:hypothetical protein
MNRLIALLLLTIFVSCNNKTEKQTAHVKTSTRITPPFDRGNLDYYFAQFEIKPSIAVNNTEDTQTVIQLSKHKIKWLNTDDETKIKIDNDLFTLKDKATINIVWENKDSVDFANNWDEMKLYKFNDREIIGVRMSNHRCNGIGCSVDYFLVYDCQTKTKTFFGTFRNDNRLALYNFNNDEKLDYLSKTFNGDAGGSTPMEFIYELYSMENNEHFVQQKNSNGQTYQIKQTTFPNDTTKTETFEQRWLTEIK